MVKSAPAKLVKLSSAFHKKGLQTMLLVFVFFLPLKSFAKESDSSRVSPQKLRMLAAGSAVGYGSLLTGLHLLWYQDNPQTGFHFFNDNKQWMQTDKAGHIYSTFQLSRAGSEALKWTGMSSEKSAVFGSLGGWLFMLPVEILDGYSPEYGASWGDLAANGLGSFLYAGQVLLWDEVLLKPKFSFHPSPFAAQRPQILGDGFATQLLKDYNGQTYWLSADMDKMLPAGNKFPRWLNIAAGYGAEGMVFGHREANYLAGYDPHPQFYLSPDIDLSFIRTKNKALKILFFILEGVKLPAPALEFNKNRIRFHPVYF